MHAGTISIHVARSVGVYPLHEKTELNPPGPLPFKDAYYAPTIVTNARSVQKVIVVKLYKSFIINFK